MESKTYIVNNEPFEVQEMSKSQMEFDKLKTSVKELFIAIWELEKVLAMLSLLLIVSYSTLSFVSWLLQVPQDGKLKLAGSVILVAVLSVKLSIDKVAKRLKKHGKVTKI